MDPEMSHKNNNVSVTWLHVFSYGYWLETELQMILLMMGIYFIVSLCKTLQICSVYSFHLQMHQY